jgi:CMP/dCMP kinase
MTPDLHFYPHGVSMSPPRIIAIDGPAASGKSTLAKRLAEHLGYLYFDTGVLYRAITWAALENGIDVEQEVEVTQLAEQLEIDVRPPSQADGRSFDVWIDEQDITWKIRHPQVDAKVSIVSAYPGVRMALIEKQRRIGLRGEVVMVGRDIGTVVLPEADLKIYLDASVEERARRRYDELLERGISPDLVEIEHSMRERDRIDSTRQVAPLRPAEDACILDSDDLDIEQVLRRALELVNEAAHNS